jgi:hypothetical protein
LSNEIDCQKNKIPIQEGMLLLQNKSSLNFKKQMIKILRVLNKQYHSSESKKDQVSAF